MASRRAETGRALLTKSESSLTPKPRPEKQRTTPFSLFSDEVAHSTGMAALPLNSMYGPMFGENDEVQLQHRRVEDAIQLRFRDALRPLTFGATRPQTRGGDSGSGSGVEKRASGSGRPPIVIDRA